MKITLKAARVNAGLTQTDVATALKVDRSTVVGWESGKHKISADKLLALCELYGIPAELLKI